MKKLSLFILLLGLAFVVNSEEILNFSNQSYKARYEQLLEELRCLVCQNQNLADSSAGLAVDLKREVYNMVEAGKSNEEIKSFLTLRYGDFVLYKPPFNARTVFLWLGPFILLSAAFAFLFFYIKNRQAENNQMAQLSSTEKEKLQQLLQEHNSE